MMTSATHPLQRFGTGYKARVEHALSLLAQGKGVLLVDDENRENEGDLVFAAQTVSVQDMALLIRQCSGIVCLCLTPEHADRLELPPMVATNTSRYQTGFTVSIEATKDITTGVSAADRVQTIRMACAPDARPEDLARPGHIFPLRAKANGVLERRGHTEGSIDLVKLAGLQPAAVLCELTNADGSMAKLEEICRFAETHGLCVVSIDDIVQYRTFVKDTH